MTLTAALTTAKTRILAMELLAVSGSKAAESFASFTYQSGFPYWTNRVGNIPDLVETSALFYRWTVPFIARLVVGYVGAGWRGEYEDDLQWTYIPDVLTYFTKYNRLVYTTGQVPPKYFEVEAFKIRSTGLQLFAQPDGGFYVGTEFPLTLVFNVPIDME